MTPLVSIIVSIYKVPLKYLRKCLESLTAQTMQNCEFIIVSDGASEEESKICEEFVAKDTRFKFFRRNHAGVSAARNFGIKQAQGEYITLVDSDDWIDSKMSESAYDYAKENDSDIVLWDYTIAEEGKKNEFLYLAENSIKKFSDSQKEAVIKNIINPQSKNFSSAPWGKLFRKKILDELKIYFCQEITIGEDRVFNYMFFSEATNLSYLKKSFYFYRIHSSSAIHRYRPDALPVLLRYVKKLKDLTGNEYQREVGREAVNVFFWSWNLCYMHPQNSDSLFLRIKKLSQIVLSLEFQNLIYHVDKEGLSRLVRFELWLFQHKIVFPIWLHGLKQFMLINWKRL